MSLTDTSSLSAGLSQKAVPALSWTGSFQWLEIHLSSSIQTAPVSVPGADSLRVNFHSFPPVMVTTDLHSFFPAEFFSTSQKTIPIHTIIIRPRSIIYSSTEVSLSRLLKRQHYSPNLRDLNCWNEIQSLRNSSLCKSIDFTTHFRTELTSS